MVEVRWSNDRMMSFKLVVGSHVVHVVSAYAPQWAYIRKSKSSFGKI